MEDAERAHPHPVPVLSQPLTLGLPSNNHDHHHPNYLQPGNGGGGGGGGGGGSGGRDECWSEGATITLIDAWGGRYLQLNRGNLKQKHWREVADAVNARAGGKIRKTDVQCKNRLDTLKKKYKVEKAKVLGGGASSWPFYARLDDLIGPSRKHQALKVEPPPPLPPPPQQQLQAHPLQPQALRQVLPEGEGFDPATSGSRDTTESCPNPATAAHVGKSGGGGKKRSRSPASGAAAAESPLRELAQAILKFGEVYERIESTKQQQIMELERMRMEFTKDLEIQRLQHFMQTQIELAKMERTKNGSTEHYL